MMELNRLDRPQLHRSYTSEGAVVAGFHQAQGSDDSSFDDEECDDLYAEEIETFFARYAGGLHANSVSTRRSVSTFSTRSSLASFQSSSSSVTMSEFDPDCSFLLGLDEDLVIDDSPTLPKRRTSCNSFGLLEIDRSISSSSDRIPTKPGRRTSFAVADNSESDCPPGLPGRRADFEVIWERLGMSDSDRSTPSTGTPTMRDDSTPRKPGRRTSVRSLSNCDQSSIASEMKKSTMGQLVPSPRPFKATRVFTSRVA